MITNFEYKLKDNKLDLQITRNVQVKVEIEVAFSVTIKIDKQNLNNN